MKALVINADDFGISLGVNKGIIKAHNKGIVTSTSIIVHGIAVEEAKVLLKYPQLSVGLHFDITGEGLRANLKKRVILPLLKIKKIKKEFEQQIKKFIEVVGRLPDHLDSHRHVHLHPKVKPIFEEYSQKHNIPVRSFGNVNFINSFFGWNKLRRRDLKRINPDSLLKILANLKDGVNEIMCHPGFVDEGLRRISGYLEEREEEVKTLTDKKVINYIKKSGIKLCSWKEI